VSLQPSVFPNGEFNITVNSKELIGDIVINEVGYNPVYQQCGSFYLNKKAEIIKKRLSARMSYKMLPVRYSIVKNM